MGDKHVIINEHSSEDEEDDATYLRSPIKAGRRASLSKRVSFRERLTLSPLEKFKQYNKFPFKLVFNILVLVFASSFLLLRNIQFADFTNETVDAVRTLLQDEAEGATFIYTINDVCDHLTTTVEGYFKFSDTSVTYFETDPVITMDVTFRNGTDRQYSLTTANAEGPISIIRSPSVFQEIMVIQVLYFFRVKQHRGESGGPFLDVAYSWSAMGQYSMYIGGGRTDYAVSLESSIEHWSADTLIAINGVILGLSAISLLLTLKALVKGYDVYRTCRKRLDQPDTNDGRMYWSQLTIVDKCTFFNLWHVCSGIGDLFLIVACSLAFRRQAGDTKDVHKNLQFEDVARAIGVFCNWVGLLKYFEWRSELYMLILALKASGMRVLQFILTVAPIYMAYMFVGMSCFYDEPELFGDISKSSQTLFALLNGDSILAVYEQLQFRADLPRRIFAQVYLYSFCIFFITSVLNVFIFIIEGGYDVARDCIYGRQKYRMKEDTQRLKQIIDAACERTGSWNVDFEGTYDMKSKSRANKTRQRALSSAAKMCRCACTCGMRAPLAGAQETSDNAGADDFVAEIDRLKRELVYKLDRLKSRQSDYYDSDD